MMTNTKLFIMARPFKSPMKIGKSISLKLKIREFINLPCRSIELRRDFKNLCLNLTSIVLRPMKSSLWFAEGLKLMFNYSRNTQNMLVV
jgi:hypothetical protein